MLLPKEDQSEPEMQQFWNVMLFNRKNRGESPNNLPGLLFCKVKSVCKCVCVIVSRLHSSHRNAESWNWLCVDSGPVGFVEYARRKPGVPGSGLGERAGNGGRDWEAELWPPICATQLPLFPILWRFLCPSLKKKFPSFGKLLKPVITCWWVILFFLWMETVRPRRFK